MPVPKKAKGTEAGDTGDCKPPWTLGIEPRSLQEHYMLNGYMEGKDGGREGLMRDRGRVCVVCALLPPESW